MRAIFGVVNNDEFSARPGEPGVKGFGLRTGRASRNDDNFDVRGSGNGDGGRDGIDVVAFDDEFDVERFRWVVRTYASKCQK